MKNTIITILLLLSIILLPLSVDASEERTDSLNIDTETRQLLGVAEDVQVMKFYHDSPLIWIRDGRPIENMMKPIGPMHTSYIYPVCDLTTIDPYAEHHDRGPTPGFAAKIVEDGIVEDAQFYYSYTCRYFYELNNKHEQILKTLGDHVVAEKIYYFTDTMYIRDLVVYYVTNVGDYVLYASFYKWAEDSESYLLSVEEFRPYAGEIQAYCSERDGLTVYIPEGLKDYKLDLSERNVEEDPKADIAPVILYCTIPAVIIAAGAVCILLHRRKKQKNSKSISTE